MRKRHSLYLIAALALAAAFVVTGSAVSSEPVQSLEAQAIPDKRPASTQKGVVLRAKPSTIDSADDTDVLPEKTDNFILDMDADFKVAKPKGLDKCDPADLAGDDLATAMKTCGYPSKKSWIGHGTAHVQLATGPSSAITLHATVVAYAAKNSACGGDAERSVVLYSRVGPPANVTTVLCGRIKDSPEGGEYGKRFEVAVPPLAAGAASFSDFEVFLARQWKFKGIVKDILKAKCSDGTWDFRSEVSYGADHDPEVDTVAQPCTN